MSPKITRRRFGALVGAGALACAAPGSAGARYAPGRIGVARSGEGTEFNARTARGLIERALTAAVPGAASASDCARALFEPGERIGVKLNCLAGPMLSPRVDLVGAFADVLAAAGLDPADIVVFERTGRELRAAGFHVNRSGRRYRCIGTDNDYEPEVTVAGEIGSCFATLVRQCDALVSFGVVKDHDLCGVSAGMKNWYGVIHNPNKYHDNNCDPYVADIVGHLRDTIRLTVLDGMRAQFQGGPAFHADGLWDLGVVAASTDPVAADAWAWRVIDGEREKRGLKSLSEEKRPPRFIDTAARRGLGVGDPDALEVVET